MGAVLEGFFFVGHLISELSEDFIQEVQAFVFLVAQAMLCFAESQRHQK